MITLTLKWDESPKIDMQYLLSSGAAAATTKDVQVTLKYVKVRMC